MMLKFLRNFNGSNSPNYQTFYKKFNLNKTPFTKKPEAFEEIVFRVEEKYGIGRDSSVFLPAVFVLSSLSEETFESKCNVFKRFGWTQVDILTIMRRNPCCLGLSEARIERSLWFLVKELNYDPVYLASHPTLIACSLENRILPRHRVLTVLKEKGLVKKSYALTSAISMGESAFFKKFVLPYEDVHEAYSKLIGCSVKMLDATMTE